MATKLIEKTYCPFRDAYECEYLCDTDTDFADLPESAPGSTAISIETGNVRIVNTQGEWVPFAE